MFIAHLPAGYILSRVHPKLQALQHWVLLGAVAPDADLLFAAFVHHGAVHHHTYLSHRPALWLVICLSGLALRHRTGGAALAVIGLGGVLHMALDSIAGAIAWGWPLSGRAFPLVVVPATQDWWVMSFVLHWSFAIEGLICAGAAALWWRK